MALAACVSAACGTAGGTRHERTLNVTGTTRTYAVVSPDPMPEGPLPVVLVFHGGGPSSVETADNLGRYTGMDRKAQEAGFLAVYPRARTDNWNDGRDSPTLQDQADGVDDVGFVRALLDAVAAEFPVDNTRIYATGISNGGIFSHRLACELTDRLAAVASVVGALAEPLAPRCMPARHIAVLAIHGTADGFVPFEGGTVTAPGTQQDRGRVLSADATRDTWSRLNGCTPGALQRETVNDVVDGTSVETVRVEGCPADGTVEQVVIHGGAHTWPGSRWLPYLGRVTREFKGEDRIWAFFQRHQRSP